MSKTAHVPVTRATSGGLETLLNALPSAKRRGDGWVALCPAHDDHKPSLAINVGDNGDPVIHCRRRPSCNPNDILSALGLKWPDILRPRDGLYYFGATFGNSTRARGRYATAMVVGVIQEAT